MSWKYVQRNTETGQYRTTDQGGGGGSSHTYSTTEQVVGTWIDGKPLYEKTLKIMNDITFQSGVEIQTGITNPDIVMIKEGYFYDSANNDMIGVLPFNQSLTNVSGDWIYNPVYKRSTNVICLKTSAQFVTNVERYLILVLQYTKTTDA